MPRCDGTSASGPLGGCGQGGEQFGEAGSVVDVDRDAGECVGQEQDRAVGPADQGPPVSVRAHQAGVA